LVAAEICSWNEDIDVSPEICRCLDATPRILVHCNMTYFKLIRTHVKQNLLQCTICVVMLIYAKNQ